MDFLKTAMETMEIPADAAPRYSYLQIYGSKKVILENYARMIDYDQKRLLLQCRSCRIEIIGSCLEIQQYSKQEMVIEGNIETVNFL